MDICKLMLILLFVNHPAYAFLGALLQPISVLKGDDSNHNQNMKNNSKGISQSRNTKIGQQLTCYDFPNRYGHIHRRIVLIKNRISVFVSEI